MTDAMQDKEGYLLDFAAWNETTASAIAQKTDLSLSTEHWLIIHYLRQFHQDFPTLKQPAMRVLIKFLRENLGEAKGNSLYFHRLFPLGLVQACKIAGLPNAGRCRKKYF